MNREKIMKALTIPRIGSADVLDYTEVPLPIVPQGCLLVKVSTMGLSFGDVMIRKGEYPHMPPLPFIPGFEACGVVTQVGDGVDRAWLDQRVVVSVMNAHAEYLVVPALFAARVAQSVSDEAAAAVPSNYLTALKMLDDIGRAVTGETILIHAAAGGVGTALLQLAKLRGLKTIGIAGGAEKCAFTLDQGADAAIDYLSEDVPARLREITDGRGVDVSFNSVCGNTLYDDVEGLAPFGRLVIFGMAMGPPPSDLIQKFLARFSDSISLHTFSFETVAVHQAADVGSSLHMLMELLAAGKIAPPIWRVFDLRDAAEAHEMLESRKVLGKVVFRINS